MSSEEPQHNGATPQDADRPIDLALEPRFRLGALVVAPATREVRGPVSRDILEPRVMQVLVRLARTPGEVVSRDALFAACWEGRIVGEDAMNRVMSRLRKVSELDGGGGFTLETIRQVGYRLWPVSAPNVGFAEETPPFPSPPGSLEQNGKPTIGVLPFVLLSGTDEQDDFADSLASDIVTALSRWRWFSTIGWSGSLRFKGAGAGVREFGDRLGARYVLEGGLRRAGARLRLNLRLVDAVSDVGLWAERYDRELTDVFALQDEITGQVVAAVEAAMLFNECTVRTRKPTEGRSALDLYFCGMAHLQKDTEEGWREGLQAFQACIEREPGLALGHAGLARVLYGGVVDGWSAAPEMDLQRARACGRTAIDLDPREAFGSYAVSGASLYLADFPTAMEHARRAVTLIPSFALGHWRLGQVLTHAGRAEEAVKALQLGVRLNPYDPQLGPMLGQLSLALFHAGDYEGAERQADAAVSYKFPRASAVLAASLIELGRSDEAAQAYRRYAALPPAPGGLMPPYADRAQFRRLRDAVAMAGNVAALG